MTRIGLLVEIALPAFLCGFLSLCALGLWIARGHAPAEQDKPAADPPDDPDWDRLEFDADLALRDLRAGYEAMQRGEIPLARHELLRAIEHLEQVHDRIETDLMEAA